MKLPSIKLSTLIVLHLVGALLLWLNVAEAIASTNQYVVPLGWPNEAAYYFQESYHALRAERGFAAEWGYVGWHALACNAILFVSILGALFLLLERKQLLRMPHRNTRWMLAGVFAVLLAANICKRPDTFLDDQPHYGPGYGLPYIAYSWERKIMGFLSNDPSENESRYVTNRGWHLPNLFANLAVAGWILFAVYTLCERRYAAARNAAPVLTQERMHAGP